MSKKIKFLIALVAFLLVLAACFTAYKSLSEKYVPETPGLSAPATPEQTPENSETSAPEQTPSSGTEDEEIDNAVLAPDFTVLDMQGNEVKLSDMLGKPVVLNFWATWCGPCKGEMPHFQKLYDEYGDKVHFMMINLTDGAQDTVEKVEQFIMENGYTFPVYCDTSMYASYIYGVNSVPMTFFIGANGEALYYQLGTMNEDMLRGAIETVLGE